jgi:hypothetical protein
MRDNIAYAVFENCNKAVTNALWQYDYGQVLQISGVELPETFEVHLCNRGNNATITQIGQNYQVSIPDEFLTNPTWIDAYIFLHSGLDDGETVYSISIPVSVRPMPTDDEPMMGGNACSECASCCYTYLCVNCLFNLCCGCH